MRTGNDLRSKVGRLRSFGRCEEYSVEHFIVAVHESMKTLWKLDDEKFKIV